MFITKCLYNLLSSVFMWRNIVVGMVGKYVRGILAVYSVLVTVDMVL